MNDQPHAHDRFTTLSRRSLLRAASSAAILSSTGACFGRRPASGRRVIVHVELRGGNDALNTLIPANDPRYRAARPRIARTGEQVAKIATGTYWNTMLNPLAEAWNAGELAFVRGVGVPGGDRSHFHAQDQWAAGRLDPGIPSGWLGRLNLQGAGALSIDVAPVGSALVRTRPCVVVPDLEAVAGQPNVLDAQCRGELRSLLQSPLGGDELDGPLREGLDLADAVNASTWDDAASQKTDIDGRSPLGERLALVAGLLEAGHPARAFALSIGGFDTHSLQEYDHGELLRELSEGLAGFRRRLAAWPGHWEPLVLVTSEFGRRIAENASGGTDHGLAGLSIAWGSGVRGGLYGPPFDLDDTDAGDLKVRVDFRRVLAETLAFVDRDPRDILGRDAPTEPVGFLV